MKTISFRRLALLLILVVPLLAWMLVKPVRVIAPRLVGIDCGPAPVCVEDPAQRRAAEQLYAEGLAFLAQQISPLDGAPRVVFCATQACADAFGLGARSAITVGTVGTVIGPRAWKPYYVRHELIHQLQGQRLGVLRLLFMPSWWVEGMAYALSDDPRAPLAQPWEDHRRRFLEWWPSIGQARLWQEAGKL